MDKSAQLRNTSQPKKTRHNYNTTQLVCTWFQSEKTEIAQLNLTIGKLNPIKSSRDSHTKQHQEPQSPKIMPLWRTELLSSIYTTSVLQKPTTNLSELQDRVKQSSYHNSTTANRMVGEQNRPRKSSEPNRGTSSPRGSDPNLHLPNRDGGTGGWRNRGAHLGGRMMKFTSWSIGWERERERNLREKWRKIEGLGARSKAGNSALSLSPRSLAFPPSLSLLWSLLISPTFSSPRTPAPHFFI